MPSCSGFTPKQHAGEEALALRLMDLDAEQGLIRLREKGGTERWQPITLELARHLADHASQRGVRLPGDGLLRYRNGHTLTTRRYDALWARLGRYLPWVAAQGISTQWLRHTTLTWVERHFGSGIARAYAGHTDSNGPATTTYIKANLQAVATGLGCDDRTAASTRRLGRRARPVAVRNIRSAGGGPVLLRGGR